MITDMLQDPPAIDRAANAERLVTLSLATLCSILGAHGVTEATIDYDGYGDEGQVNDILLHDADRRPVAMPAARCTAYHLTHLGALESEEASLEQPSTVSRPERSRRFMPAGRTTRARLVRSSSTSRPL